MIKVIHPYNEWLRHLTRIHLVWKMGNHIENKASGKKMLKFLSWRQLFKNSYLEKLPACTAQTPGPDFPEQYIWKLQHACIHFTTSCTLPWRSYTQKPHVLQLGSHVVQLFFFRWCTIPYLPCTSLMFNASFCDSSSKTKQRGRGWISFNKCIETRLFNRAMHGSRGPRSKAADALMSLEQRGNYQQFKMDWQIGNCLI